MTLPDWTVSAVAAAVRSGALSPTEALEESLGRIGAHNESLNAVVVLAEERARARAATIPTTGRLAGVPMLAKDLHAEIEGMPLARGSRLLKGTTHACSSWLVERLEAEGAVIVGRTNSPEFGLNITTEPQLWGPCRNPHDTSRSAGGSSGGSAAAVAAGMVPAAHGSDSGGSLRIPSSWCGVFGFKPSRGLVPHGPHRTNPWEGLSHEHAITTTIEDSRLLLEVAADGDFSSAGLDRLRVGVIDRPPGGTIDSDCIAPVEAVASLLSAGGHAVERIELPPVVAELGRLVKPIIAAHLAAVILDHPGAIDALDTLERANRELVTLGTAMSASDLLRARHQLELARRALADHWAGFDLLVLPVTARVAPPMGELSTDRSPEELFGEMFSLAPFTLMFNVTGEPAMSMPWSHDAGGVPVGVQLAGRPGTDALLLAIAEQLARRTS